MRRRRLVAFAFALSVTPGCEAREPNTDLSAALRTTPIQPSQTPTSVTSESPYTLSGTIIESGAGVPLSNVLVETTHGRTTLTNASGFYEFARLGHTDVSFSKEGFEGPGPFGVAMWHPITINTSLQRVIRMPANQALTAVLFPNDPYLNVSGETWADMGGWVCGPPCKVVRVAVTPSGRLRARVTWQPSTSPPNFDLMLAQRIGSARPTVTGARGRSGDLTAEMSLAGGADVRVYFGPVNIDSDPWSHTGLPMDLAFELTTSISP